MPTPLLDNRQLGPDVARSNLLTNGGFEVNQRGAGPWTTGYTSDRWQTEGAGITVTIDGGAANVDVGSQFAAKTVITGNTNLSQFLEAYPGALRGRILSGSVRVKCSVANAVYLTITSDGTAPASTSSTMHPGDGTYRTLTVTTSAAIPLDASKVYFRIQHNNTAGTVWIDNAMLVIGSQPADYVPMHPADDLARCLRYYEIIFAEAQGVTTGASQSVGGGVGYAVKKAVSPTLTKVGTWGVTNASQPTIVARADGFLNGFSFVCQSIASGPANTYISASGQYITAEANP